MYGAWHGAVMASCYSKLIYIPERHFGRGTDSGSCRASSCGEGDAEGCVKCCGGIEGVFGGILHWGLPSG